MHPALILVLGTFTLGVFVVSVLVAQWLYLDHRARRNYELRLHTLKHRFTAQPGCRFCSRRLS